MRILFLAPQPFFEERGTPLNVRSMLCALGELGHELDALVYHEGEDVSIPKCTLHRIPAIPGVRGVRPGLSLKKLLCDLFFAGRAIRLARRNDYDVVHAVEESAFVAILLKLLFGLPYIYDMDSGLTQQAVDKWPVLRLLRPLMVRFEAMAVRRSLYVVPVCKLLGDRARGLAPEGRIAVIEDMGLLGESGEEKEPLPEIGGQIVMYVGNLEPYQGIDLLLEGFSLAAERIPDANLVVIGGRPDKIRHYELRARELGIESQAHLVGPRPHGALRDYLARAALLVSPRTKGVNTPMKIYAYMASGTAMLATRLPTHTQVLTDDVARLFDPDPESLAEALVAMFGDHDLRARLATRAAELEEREFSPAAHKRKVRDLYAEVERELRAPETRAASSSSRPRRHLDSGRATAAGARRGSKR